MLIEEVENENWKRIVFPHGWDWYDEIEPEELGVCAEG